MVLATAKEERDLFPRLLENLGFFLKFPDSGRSWKMSVILESSGIYLWFKLYDRHSVEFGLLLTDETL